MKILHLLLHILIIITNVKLINIMIIIFITDIILLNMV
jgi:hypothetical protein